MIIKPAEKNGEDSGRPKNVMFVSIPSAFKNMLKDVSSPHYRVQAVLIKTESNIVILNTYFPTDSHNFHSDDPELKEVLKVIRSVIKSCGTRHVIWGGDINAIFLRMTGNDKAITEFIESLSLIRSWDKYEVDFIHCYEINGNSLTNKLDF